MTIIDTLVVILLFVATLLLFGHNWLMHQIPKNMLPEALYLKALTPREKAIVYLVLVGGSVLLMLILTDFSLPSVPFFKIISLMVMTITLVTHFFLLNTLHIVLDEMKRDKQLLPNLMYQQAFWWSIYIIIFTELSFLYWLKETTTYFEWPFFFFVIGYSGIILIVEFLILYFSQRKQDILSEDKSNEESIDRWHIFCSIVDSLIIVIFSIIFLYITKLIIFPYID